MFDKLRLHDSLEDSSRYIQALTYPTGTKINPYCFGGGLQNGGFTDKQYQLINKNLFSFYYMGAAEFEFGSVPNAFHFLIEQAKNDNLVYGKIEIDKFPIHYISPKNYEEEVKIRIREIGRKHSSLANNMKVPCYLYEDIQEYRNKKEKKGMSLKIGYLELNNGFMFFLDEQIFFNLKYFFEDISDVYRE